jgi:hypothetical protein
MNPTLKTAPATRFDHDKSVRNRASAPPQLFRLRRRIYLQPVRDVLVHGRNRATADAGRRRRLLVPGLFAEDGGGDKRFAVVMRANFGVPRTPRSAKRCAADPGSILFSNEQVPAPVYAKASPGLRSKAAEASAKAAAEQREGRCTASGTRCNYSAGPAKR